MTRAGSPPRAAVDWLMRWLPIDQREMIVGDLVELFADRVEAGRRLNALWFWAQTLGVTVGFAVVDLHGHARLQPGRFIMLTTGRLAVSFRQALRRLAFEWRYTFGVVLILGIGIGPAAAMLSIVQTVWLDPLDFEAPHELGIIRLNLGQIQNHPGISPDEVRDLRGMADLFSGVETQARRSEVSLGPADRLAPLNAVSMTAGMLPMLGVSPILGRHLTDPQAPPPPQPPTAPGAPPAPPRPPPPPQPVLLDYEAWQAHFGGDPDILDRTILLNGRATEVSGVLPRGFRLPTGRGVPQRADVYMPMRLFEIRNAWQFPTLVRLAAGVSVAEANARLDALAAALTAKYPEHYANTNLRFTFSPLLDDMLRETRPALRAALAGVLLLLLIAVANTTALVVARLKTRERDFAIRSAIGAGRGALVAEVLMESVILSGYGAMVGTAVAAGSAGAARAMVLQSVPRWEQVGVSWELIGYSAAFAMLGLFGAGLIPVWKVLRTAPSQLVRSASAQGGRAEGATSRLLLVGVQITLTLVLTFGAVQLVRSAGRLADVDIGFDAHVLTFRVPLDSRVHNTRPKQAVLYQRIRDRLRQVPGVQAVGANSHLPLSGATLTDGYTADLAGAASMDQAMANYHSVLPGYFESVRIPIVDGRDFSDAENANGEPVIVVDETLARAAFPARSPIGRTLKVGWGIPDSRIVGVVRPVRNIEVGRHVRPQIYVPYGRFAWQPLIFTVRASGDPLQLVDAAEAAVREIGPGRAVSGFQVLQDNVTAATSTLHAVTGLVILLATSAGVLSAVGLYSVIAFVVHQRRRATAIRSALGASPAQLLWQHVQTSGMVILIALPAGVALAAIAAPFLGPLVYGVNERDPISLAAAAVVATSAGVLGTYLPARRAVHVDPVRVLREE